MRRINKRECWSLFIFTAVCYPQNLTICPNNWQNIGLTFFLKKKREREYTINKRSSYTIKKSELFSVTREKMGDYLWLYPKDKQIEETLKTRVVEKSQNWELLKRIECSEKVKKKRDLNLDFNDAREMINICLTLPSKNEQFFTRLKT